MWILSFAEISEILQSPFSLTGTAGGNSQELKITMSAVFPLCCAGIDILFFFFFLHTLLIAHILCTHSALHWAGTLLLFASIGIVLKGIKDYH